MEDVDSSVLNSLMSIGVRYLIRNHNMTFEGAVNYVLDTRKAMYLGERMSIELLSLMLQAVNSELAAQGKRRTPT